VLVVSSPAGATATLDGNAAMACKTPCTLNAPPGRHNVSIVMPGFQIEHRELNVGSSPQEMAPVVLRAAVGTLMLTSVPQGASVSVDGKKSAMVTPAQIPLAPGTYMITVEKDGHQATTQIQMRNEIKNLRLVIDQ
jgi:hypothetical protein